MFFDILENPPLWLPLFLDDRVMFFSSEGPQEKVTLCPITLSVWGAPLKIYPIFLFESPLVYLYPQNTRNSDHGLNFPSPETQTMV